MSVKLKPIIYNKKMAIYYILAIFFVILDRFFKILALEHFNSQTHYIFSDFLKFELARNYYIAFSIPLGGYFVNTAIILILVFLLIFMLRIDKSKFKILAPMVFIFLGASSNLFDRLNYGFVIDYISLKYFTVFNIADAMIVLATTYLLIQEFKKFSK